jgi:hypothetical protein
MYYPLILLVIIRGISNIFHVFDSSKILIASFHGIVFV